MALYPVILAVPDHCRALKGRPRVLRLSALARRAVVLSARHNQWRLTHLKKDGHGAPLPNGNLHWSLSHKTAYVAGIVAQYPVGIDIERVRPVSEGLFAKIADDDERNIDHTGDPLFFFRVWTAKEAVLKAAGVGLQDLHRCRIWAVVDRHHLRLRYQNQEWTVVHHYFQDHVVALTHRRGKIRWIHA